MSVLLVNEVPVFGGVNRVVQQLWRWLPTLGLPTRMLLPCCGGSQADRFISQWFGEAPDRVMLAPLREPGVSKAVRWRSAVRAFASAPERVVNLHFNTVPGTAFVSVCAARLAGKRVVITYQHSDEETAIPLVQRSKVTAAALLAERLVESSPFIETALRRYTKAGRVETIPLGIEPPANTARYSRDACRAKHGIPGDAFVVGHLSRLVEGKGLPRVVRAIESLKEACPDLWLAAAGSNDRDAAVLCELVQSRLSGRSRFLGELSDHNELFACSDVFAVPSGWEGFGLVYIEAAMHGLPRIGTAMGGVLHVIDDGVDGFLIPYDDTAALADRIRVLRNDPARRAAMGQAARDRAMREFTSARMAARYAELLRSL